MKVLLLAIPVLLAGCAGGQVSGAVEATRESSQQRCVAEFGHAGKSLVSLYECHVSALRTYVAQTTPYHLDLFEIAATRTMNAAAAADAKKLTPAQAEIERQKAFADAQTMALQRDQATRSASSAALFTAGAAILAGGPAPPRTTNCQRFGNTLQCSHF